MFAADVMPVLDHGSLPEKDDVPGSYASRVPAQQSPISRIHRAKMC
jgi:hypothetical protein